MYNGLPEMVNAIVFADDIGVTIVSQDHKTSGKSRFQQTRQGNQKAHLESLATKANIVGETVTEYKRYNAKPSAPYFELLGRFCFMHLLSGPPIKCIADIVHVQGNI